MYILLTLLVCSPILLRSASRNRTNRYCSICIVGEHIPDEEFRALDVVVESVKYAIDDKEQDTGSAIAWCLVGNALHNM